MLAHGRQLAAAYLQALDPGATEFLFVGIREEAFGGGTMSLYGSLEAHWPKITSLNTPQGFSWFVTVNETNGNRRRAGDIIRARAFFIDIDSKEMSSAFAAWCKTVPANYWPNVLVTSSKGKVHAYWLIDNCPLEQWTMIQKALAEKFTSDTSVCDLPRIMRLPGTYNVKAKYETPASVACAVSSYDRWEVGAFVEALGLNLKGQKVAFTDKLKAAQVQVQQLQEVDGENSYWFDTLEGPEKDLALRHACGALQTLFEKTADGGDNFKYFKLACAIARSGAPNAQVIFVEHARQAQNPDSDEDLAAYFQRTDIQVSREDGVTIKTLLKWARDSGADFSHWEQMATRAKLANKGALSATPSAEIKPGVYAPDEAIALLSENLFMGQSGQLYRILGPGRADPVKPQTMRDLYANVTIKYELDGGAKPAFEHWRKSELRPTREVIFDPNQAPGLGGLVKGPFNQWRGFRRDKDPDKSKTASIHEMILHNICNSNALHYDYVLNWCAQLLQEVGKPIGTVLNLIGTGGAGKSTFGELLVAEYFGDHGFTLSTREQLGNKFNSRFEGKLVVFVEEVVFYGDGAMTDQFKALVTSKTIEIERKGFEAQTAANRISYIMATNHNHAFNSDPGMRRRIFPLRVSDNMTRNKALVDDARRDIELGGREAFWDEMLARDIANFNPHEFPENAEIQRQAAMSLGPVADFILAVAEAGEIVLDQYGAPRSLPCRVTKAELNRAYGLHVRGHRMIAQAKLCAEFEQITAIPHTRPRSGNDSSRARSYELPSASDLRARVLPHEKDEQVGNENTDELAA